MDFVNERRAAARLLDALENATLSPEDTRPLLEAADPALVYLIVGWLRVHYHAGHSASEGVLGRIVEQVRRSKAVTASLAEGEADPVVAWFEETYDYRDLDRDEFLELVVEKLEG
ncbi:MAG: hypothetical protein JXX28_06500 [Deltaproteobacteria bacterium]|nr:hypothetical protein [Deltaproteobacteria bacterium]